MHVCAHIDNPKLLEENVVSTLQLIGIGKDFLTKSSEQETKATISEISWN